MREKFWDYMANPSEKKKAELTTMEQNFAQVLEGQDKWPDGKKKGGGSAPKAKSK
jgi:hypothetical protein